MMMARPALPKITAAARPLDVICSALLAPACCGRCGLPARHPIARACIDAECPLGAARRVANDFTRGGK